ncbi:MAG TPA: ABC transporter permease, partial [Alphaproteobacteria bacterium]|nr:ABC transporter permease [Alphaproteobacteria bacterium]
MHQLGEEEGARSYWGLPRLESILQDLRFGLRMLRKTPGVSLVAITVLALGIGSNIAVFSIIDTFYFRPLPVANASRLIGLYATDEQYRFHSVSYPEYAYLRDHNSTTMGLAAHYSTAPLNLVTESDSREVQGAVVSANYFSLLGLTPALGRFFLQEEDSVPDRDAVAVISSRLWRERFDRNPSILQQKIKINGVFFQVVGVMPEGFEGVLPGNANEIYIPTMMLHAGYRWCDTFQLDCTPLNMIGRLKPGVRMADAQADFQVLARQLAAAYPQTLPGRGALIVPVTGANPRSRVAMTTEVQLLIGISAVLLLIVCANVAGLLLVRGEARRKEIAIRLSIGAGWLRVVRQLLTEGLAMVILGGGAGLLASVWIKARLAAFYLFDSEGYVHRYDFSMNPRVALISAGLCLVTAMLFGLAPALAATKQDFVTGLKGESNAIGVRGSRGLRNSLVAAQIALSLMLVVATLLLVRSAGNIAHGGNLDPEHVALLRLRPRLVNYTPEKAQAYIHEVVRRLQNLAEVQAITYARGQGTVWNGGREAEISLPGHAIGASNHGLIVNYQQVSAGYFSTLKLPLLQGREFDDNDNLKTPHVAIVNQTLARRLWPQADALGQIVLVDGQACRVVGIAADIALHSASAPLEAFVYTPFWQDPTQVDVRMAIRVRS